MPLISLSKVSFDYGRVSLLRNVDFAIERGERAAIVGRNGVGKTTLFNILTGELRSDLGSVDRPRRLRIAYLRQDFSVSAEASLFESVRGAQTEIVALERELQEHLTRMEVQPEGPAHDTLVTRYGELQAHFEALEGYALDARVGAVLDGLGFRKEDLHRPAAELSGGEQRVAALASILLQKADLLLLDEPTNHLDLAAIEWLEDFLLQEKSAMLMVSHDRAFMDKLCQTTWHLKDARLRRYPGGFSKFEMLREERERLDYIAWRRQQEEIARLKDYIARNMVGQKTKQAQSRQKVLDKIKRIDRPSNERTLNLRLDRARQGGSTALSVEGLAKAFGSRRLFEDLNLHIARGERIGLIGPNGAGKSTLIKILLGRLDADAGTVKLGKDVDAGFFDQHLDEVSDANTVEAEFRTVDPAMGERECRTQLARFGFFADDLDKRVFQLSGGERNRLSLLKLVYRRNNFLVLDEPTNHLDIQATQSLEEALAAYAGTLIVVSHDRVFLERIAERIIDIEGGKVTDYSGTFGEYQRWRKRRPEPVAAEPNGKNAREDAKPAAVKKPRRGLWSKNRLTRRRRELTVLEESIAAAQAERNTIEARLAEPAGLAESGVRDLAWKHREILETLERREERWEKWALELEKQDEAAGD